MSAEALGLGRPRNANCGQCHGLVHESRAPMSPEQLSAGQRMTELQGVAFSPQRMRDSGLNLAGKDGLERPFDVHAERLVGCTDCHFSPNHPAYSAAETPAHLRFDARRADIGEYLRRPDHDFAKGWSTQGTEAQHLDGGIRRCESCHDAVKAHAWLPRPERHFAAMLCESCHVPRAHLPARNETDWTMLNAAGQARVSHRGGRHDGFATGFEPVLLPRRQPDGTTKLAPNNLVVTWYWVDEHQGGTRPVPRALLARAFLTGGGHRRELVQALDASGDGKLDDSELRLDTADRVSLARGLLVAAGARAPAIVGDIQPFGIHHGIATGGFATRECSECHSRDSRLTRPMVLAENGPHGVEPRLVGDANLTLAPPERAAGGRLVARPALAGLHVFGHTRSTGTDNLGLFLFGAVVAGALGHGALRVRAARRRRKEQP